MATATAKVLIDGKTIDPYRLTLEQRFDWHHSFEVAVASEKVEGKNCTTIDNSIAFVGKTIEINVGSDDNNLKFKGVVTSVQLDRTYAGDSLIVFNGYSPTFLLEDGKGTKSYEEKSLAGIAKEILGDYPANIINPSVNPAYEKSIPFVVRYKETHYHFLSRMAATYGEWFYYDGLTTVFGKLPNPDSVEMILGKDLNSFGYGVQVKPSKFKYQFYKYQENRTLEKSSATFQPSWLDNYGKHALTAANQIFKTEPLNPVYQDAQEDSVIKHLAESKKSSLLSDTTFFKGESQNVGIKVGGRISANAINKVMGQSVQGLIGHFRITSVTHHLNANKDYSNRFEAIPVTVSAPPVNKNVERPEAESQVAVVIENHDPEGLGRIRAQFKWQSGNEMTPWMRIVTSSAAGGRGMYFIPEIDDEVYVDFDQGNPDRPYSTGALFHGKAKPTWTDALNNIKALKTRGGNEVELNDKKDEQSLTIRDANGNTIHIDTASNTITITALEDLKIKAKNMQIEIEETIDIKAGKDINTKVDENMTTEIGKNLKEKVGEKKTESVEKSITTKAGEDIKMESKKSITIKADKTLSLKGEQKVTANGKDIKVNAASTIRISSSDTDVM